MLNWCGQDIVEGSIVGRGARDGNTSSYKIGRVISVSEEPNPYGSGTSKKAKVEWLHDRSRYARLVKSTVDLDGLFLLDPEVLHNFIA